LNYNDQKLEARFVSRRAAARGTDLHNLAHECIRLRVKLSNTDKTLAAYVKDGIEYDMATEQPLYYSDNCFGHADSICFRRRKLRIHDLKSGVGKTSMTQLEVYAALFCLEYEVSPWDIEIELRIYQNGEIQVCHPSPDDILHIMDRIVTLDQKIELLKGEL